MKSIAMALCALLGAGSAFADSPFVPNRIKYRDSGHQPATGRAGGATVEALAMIDKEGVAEVELRAGEPGTLEHVQIKTGGDTTNYRVGAASFVAPLANAGRGTPVSVRANVDGTAGERVGVVDVDTTVVLRPDLHPAQIVAPAYAQIDVPLQISATVRELNGDLGARATCTLRIDGVVADRATNIWADAGGTVSCTFVHLFETEGEKQLEVTVEDVAPRDYDPSNNRATARIRIGPPQIEPTAWSMYAHEQEGWSHVRAWSVWGHDFEYRGTTWGTDVQIHVAMLHTVLNMQTMQFHYSEATEGRTVLSLQPAPLTISPLIWYQQCGYLVKPDDSLQILVCQRYKNNDRFRRPTPYDIATITLHRESADATYYGRESAPAVDGYPAYDREWYVAFQRGEQVRYGESVDFELYLTDGSKAMYLQQNVPLTKTEYPYREFTNCWGSPTTWCQSYRGAGSIKAGRASK